MSSKGRKVEVEMQLDIRPTQYDGKWYVTIADKLIGDGFSNEELADVMSKWLTTGIGDITDLISDAIEDYFKELEKP